MPPRRFRSLLWRTPVEREVDAQGLLRTAAPPRALARIEALNERLAALAEEVSGKALTS